MADTELQIAKQQSSKLRHLILTQSAVVLSLKREGGERLQQATQLLESMRDELQVLEKRVDGLMAAS